VSIGGLLVIVGAASAAFVASVMTRDQLADVVAIGD